MGLALYGGGGYEDQKISVLNNCAVLKTCYNLISKLRVQVKGVRLFYLNCIQYYVANISIISNVYDFQFYIIALARGTIFLHKCSNYLLCRAIRGRD